MSNNKCFLLYTSISNYQVVGSDLCTRTKCVLSHKMCSLLLISRVLSPKMCSLLLISRVLSHKMCSLLLISRVLSHKMCSLLLISRVLSHKMCSLLLISRVLSYKSFFILLISRVLSHKTCSLTQDVFSHTRRVVSSQMVQLLGPLPVDVFQRGKFFPDFHEFTANVTQPDGK